MSRARRTLIDYANARQYGPLTWVPSRVFCPRGKPHIVPRVEHFRRSGSGRLVVVKR